MSSSKPLLYNPDQKSKQQLIAEFVIRRKEFANLMKGLEASTPRTSPQHSLVVGQRGMGKTTLLLRVKYAVEDHPQLNKWLVPIRFSEEQYQIARLDRFWEEIADHLSIADASFDGLLEEMEKHEEADDYERIALDLLIRALKKHKKRVLVMVDNLGDLFNKFSEEENHRLREILLSKTEIQLMGASSVVLEHTFNYEKPFYEFFEEVTLKPIDKEHAVELLKTLGKQYGQEDATEQLIKENPTKIEVLRRLTGGVPRTMALLFGIFIDHQHGTTFEDLQLLIDEVNSLYKHRMDEMKPQQQRIVDALARAWDPISANEVLQRSKLNREGIATNQISAQLKVLTENQVVEPVPGPGKNKTYRIRERFFNIWYLMRYGKKQHKEEVLWLVRFLETWCTTKELQLQAEEQLKALRLGNYSQQAAYYKTMALYHVEGIESSQKLQLLEQAEAYLKACSEDVNARIIEKAKKNELDKYVSRIIKKIESGGEVVAKDMPNIAATSQIGIVISVTEKILEADVPLLKIKQFLIIGIELGSLPFINLMGIANYEVDVNEAERYFKIAIEKGATNAEFYLALLYEKQGSIELAEKYYLIAVEKDHIDAINNLALLYEKQGSIELAEKYHLIAVDKGHAKAMCNLAFLYKNKKKDLELAEKYYLMAIEKGDINAMFNLALLYENDKNAFELAEKYYLMAIEKGNTAAMNNLAHLYYNTGEKTYKIEEYLCLSHSHGDLRGSVNLAALYSRSNRTAEMLQLSDEIMNRGELYMNGEVILRLFYIILVKKQYHFLLQKFQNPETQLMKYARPFYYVVAWFMRDELPGEYEKVGPEIKETVDEIIQALQKEHDKSEVVIAEMKN